MADYKEGSDSENSAAMKECSTYKWKRAPSLKGKTWEGRSEK